MPASDILNASPYWQEELQDSMCPNYGFTRKRASTRLTKKPVGSTPWTRDTENTGHSFPFSWLQRSTACMKKIKWYFEQYEDGFFTIIDWDDPQPGGGGRHYVGRFTGDFPANETGNGMWDVQNLTFEEMPTVASIKAPSDWDNDAVRFYAYNDFGDQKLATSGDWSFVENSADGIVTTVAVGAGNAGDWACFEYRGYGFKLYMLETLSSGNCEVLLDGNVVATINLHGTAFNGAVAFPSMVCMQPNVPLDFHRVQVQALGTGESGTAVIWHSLEVMR